MEPKRKRPPVPGRPTIPGHGSGSGNGRAGGAKNPRTTEGCHNLTLAAFNGRSLRQDESLVQLEVELKNIKWHVLGLSEVRRKGEDTMTLYSGHMFYFREGDQLSQGGVGFLVNKLLRDNVLEVSSVLTRIAYLVLKLTERYTLKVIQVYAPSSSHPDDEIEAMYEDISRAIHTTTKTHFTVVMGDFNAKVGVRECDETRIGPHGIGHRNLRGQMLVNFLDMQGLFCMNTFFQKKPHRKWTWRSPDGKTKNEIDFILTDKRRIFRDVSVISRFDTGSDHRLVRGILNINFEVERSRMVKSVVRPTVLQTEIGTEKFQLELHNRFAELATTESVDRDLESVTRVIHEVGNRHFRRKRGSQKSKLSGETLELMKIDRAALTRGMEYAFTK